MKLPLIKLLFAAMVMAASSLPQSRADNPIIQTIYTADPAPMVYKGTVYVYTGHDEDKSTEFTMKDWHVYSSKDMVNWTDCGSPLSLRTLSWAKDNAWAGQAIERNGKFYWYVPVEQKIGGMAIGVAVGESPTGPFKDALGKPLVFDAFGDIDPAVFVDDNGQAYLAWGNPTYKYVKLNKDMLSYDTRVGDKGIFRGPMTVEAFGQRKTSDRPTAYEEAPWIYKRKGIYYLFHAGGRIPENLAYSTGTSPEGPWKYGGVFMPTQGSSFTNHPGVIDFKGKTYLFYHNGALPGGGGFTRSVCVDEIKFNPDGSITPFNMTKEGPAPAATLNPYVRNEAETIAWESGIATEPCSRGGMNVCSISEGDFIKVKNVDFGTAGAATFTASVSYAAQAGSFQAGSIELRLDRPDGPSIGTVPISSTGGENNWRNTTTRVSGATGIHDLFFVFKGKTTGDLFKFDYWQFASKAPSPAPGRAATPPHWENAPNPPMGWNSWDCFGTTISEAQAKAEADEMAKQLKPFGWTFFTVDIQWYEEGAEGHVYKEGAPLAMDKFGRLVPAPKKFPSAADGVGFKALADYIHAKGLKFGIHIMRGISRQAVHENTPIFGATFRATDIANQNSTCPWNPDMFGVDMSKPGAQAYYDSIFALYASWGVDLVKVDDMSRDYDDGQRAEIEAIRRAIDKTGRPIVLSLSPGDTPIARGEHVMQHANMWRISDDFWDRWEPLHGMFSRLDQWTKYRALGAWPDADMLPFGIIEFTRPTHFTKDEQLLCMTLWCIARSPLILGADMTKLDEFTLGLLTNPEVIAVNQCSAGNRQLFRKDDLVAWVAEVPDSRDRYVALFNAQSNDSPFDFSTATSKSPVVRGSAGQQVVDISVAIKGARRLVLVVNDGGDGFFLRPTPRGLSQRSAVPKAR